MIPLHALTRRPSPHPCTPVPHGCLVVDDEAPLRAVLRRLMEDEGYDCREAASGEEALRCMAEAPPALLLSDYHMPGMSGIDLLRAVQQRWPDTAVVMITGDGDADQIVRCLDEGAMDYVTKPCRAEKVRGRVRQVMEKRRLLLENRAYRAALEARVAAQAQQYEELYLAALQSLADALEVKDAYTWGHSTRVSRFAAAIARELGVAGALAQQIELGARLHDIGKIGVREAILNKGGRLTDDEYAHVMEHPVIGWRILAPLLRDAPHALAVVRSHHERFDGTGAPDGLPGQAIPLEARIVAVADAFDAMTSGRSYRAGMAVTEAIAELRRCAGTQFDPGCVAAFERAVASGALALPGWDSAVPAVPPVVIAA